MLGTIGISYFLSRSLTSILNLKLKKQGLILNAIFAFLVLNPNLYSSDMSRLYRTSLNTIGIFAFTALATVIFLKLTDIRQRQHKSIKKRARFNFIIQIYWKYAAIGLIYFICYTTRVESYWILYPILGFVLFTIIIGLIKRDKNSILYKKSRDRKIVIGILLSGASFLAPLFILTNINSLVYGSPLIENYSKSHFSEAENLWAGVRNGRSKNISVYISKGQREAVYNISPTAKLLKPYLEIPRSTGWKSFYCQVGGDCDEFGAAWFPFALRDAAIANGSIKNEKEFQEFFKKIEIQIKSGCKNKYLICSNPGTATSVPYIGDMEKMALIRNAMAVLKYDFFGVPSFSFLGSQSSDPFGQVIFWKENTGLTNRSLTKVNRNLLSIDANLISLISKTVFIFSVGMILRGYKRRKHTPLIFLNIPLLISAGLFAFGIGALSLSWGFPISLSFYALPAVPVAQTIILLNFVIAIKLNSKN